MTEVQLHVEVPRPVVKPVEEVWLFCEKLAQKHGLSPLDVLKRLVQIGENVAKIEEMGGKVMGEVEGRQVEISAFGNVKNPPGQ